jgi:hypothetical protein
MKRYRTNSVASPRSKKNPRWECPKLNNPLAYEQLVNRITLLEQAMSYTISELTRIKDKVDKVDKVDHMSYIS